MKLYGSPTSPYVRKARVLVQEKKLAVDFVMEDPWAEDSKIPTRNPLGKVPALEIDPGNYLFDSVLVVHYLDHVDGHSLTPKDAAGYWQAQWWQALGNGILDAAVARVLRVSFVRTFRFDWRAAASVAVSTFSATPRTKSATPEVRSWSSRKLARVCHQSTGILASWRGRMASFGWPSVSPIR